MQTFAIPGWIWINLALLVGAAIFVWLKISAEEKARQQKPASKPVSAGLGRAME